MSPAIAFFGFVSWYYGKAFLDIFHVWMNFLWFVGHFFSLGALVRTLLSPWKRITETHKKGSGLEDFAETVAVNILSRIVGAFVRLWVIAFGLVVLLAVFIGGALFFLFWIVAPLVLAVAFFGGLTILI